MPRLQPIRIGDTFQRTYRRKHSDQSPWDLTGLVITFNINAAGVLHTYSTSTGLTITPLTGVINVALTAVQTALLAFDNDGASYLEIIDGSTVITRARRKERILRREDP